MRQTCARGVKPSGKDNADVKAVIFTDDSLELELPSLQASAQAVLCQQKCEPPVSAYEAALFKAIEAEARDGTPRSHLARIGLFAEEIARQMGLAIERCKLLLLSSPLHDLGKLKVPQEVLCKPCSLNAEERRAMQEHCRCGVTMLDVLMDSVSELPPVPQPIVRLAKNLMMTHHERFDGKGYPEGLSGDAIPLESRILAVADVFEALTTNRPYRAALSDHQALEVMMLDQGRRFDQEVFDSFLDCFDRVRTIRRYFKSED